MKKYQVSLCYAGYILHEVEAENEDDAYNKALELNEIYPRQIDYIELERWIEADEVIAVYEEEEDENH